MRMITTAEIEWQIKNTEILCDVEDETTDIWQQKLPCGILVDFARDFHGDFQNGHECPKDLVIINENSEILNAADYMSDVMDGFAFAHIFKDEN